MQAIDIDDLLAVDEKQRAIVRGQDEFIRALLLHLERSLEEEAVVVGPVGHADIDEAVVELAGLYGFQLAPVGHLRPLAVVELPRELADGGVGLDGLRLRDLFNRRGVVVDSSIGQGLAGLEHDRCGDAEAGRHLGDVDADRAFEVVEALTADAELPAAVLRYAGRYASEVDREVALSRANVQGVFVVLALQPAHVGDPYEVFSICGGGEGQLGVPAEAPVALVVVLVVDRDGGQAVGDRLDSPGKGLDDVGVLAARVGQRRGVVETLAVAAPGVDDVAAVGAARVVPELDHLAVDVEQLVDCHLVPFEEPEVTGGIRVFAAEGEPAFLRGLQLEPFDGPAIGIKDLDLRIEHRLAARRVDLEHPLFTGLRIEAEEVGVPAVRIFDHPGNHGRQLDRVGLFHAVVGLTLGGGGGLFIGGSRRGGCRLHTAELLAPCMFFKLQPLPGSVEASDKEGTFSRGEGQGGDDIALLVKGLQGIEARQRPGLDGAVGRGRSEA